MAPRPMERFNTGEVSVADEEQAGSEEGCRGRADRGGRLCYGRGQGAGRPEALLSNPIPFRGQVICQ